MKITMKGQNKRGNEVTIVLNKNEAGYRILTINGKTPNFHPAVKLLGTKIVKQPNGKMIVLYTDCVITQN